MGRKNPNNTAINEEPNTDLTAVVDFGALTEVSKPIPEDEINKIAIRRGKVRSLMQMGYGASEIYQILLKGIKVNGVLISIPMTESGIKNDIEYIRQEDASVDVELPEKRAEILDKLKFLYKQAIKEYLAAKGSVKNSFLNTALTIMNKISDIEGVNSPDAINFNVNDESKLAKYATEIQSLGEEDRNVLVTAIRQVLGKRQQESTGNDGVPSEPSELSTQTSDDEGVPREP